MPGFEWEVMNHRSWLLPFVFEKLYAQVFYRTETVKKKFYREQIFQNPEMASRGTKVP